jgi:hypothetical protein
MLSPYFPIDLNGGAEIHSCTPFAQQALRHKHAVIVATRGRQKRRQAYGLYSG